MEDLAEKFILFAVERKVVDHKQLQKAQREFSKQNSVPFLTNDTMVRAYHNLAAKEMIALDERFLKLISLKSTRSDSGIVVVSVLTKPYDCPGKCLYCPSEEGAPKSYLDQEPAVARAKMCDYDPYAQVESRLRALNAVGHITEKVNIRIIGGTWSYYPKDYREWFVGQLFAAANSEPKAESGKSKAVSFAIATPFGAVPASPNVIPNIISSCPNVIPITSNNIPASPNVIPASTNVIPAKAGIQDSDTAFQTRPEDDILSNLQKINETAKHRIVEISVETRQDFINEEEILHLRKLGVTKVELGVQSIYDDVLALNRRGNTNADTIKATKLLRDAGFKISYQVMLNLPGSSIKRDLEMFREIFGNSDYKPDHLKIYPLALVREAPIIELYDKGNYKPYNKEELIKLLKEIKKLVPCYCRVERVIRDIPAQYIVEGGSKVSNLRQEVLKELKAEGSACKCIRCREIKRKFNVDEEPILLRHDYNASDGQEVFLSFETKAGELYAMLRLRINAKPSAIPILRNSGIIREIHTYGSAVEIGRSNKFSPQHQGYGKRLVNEAERIAKEEFGLGRVTVIAGVGVREYFKKLGYQLEETYMCKLIK